MKQTEFQMNDKSRREHGGQLLIGRRKTRRPLSTKQPIHLVLRSDFAYGARSLTKHIHLIETILREAAKRYGVRVYEKAIVSNHIHLLIRGKRRIDLQNFFRMLAGHIAQNILSRHPLTENQAPKSVQRDKQNKFWETKIYSRLITWGREFKKVKNYVVQNVREATEFIIYKKRRSFG